MLGSHYLRIWPVSMISSITEMRFATKAPPAKDVTVAMVAELTGSFAKEDTPHVTAAAMSSKSTTRLDANTVDPNCVLSPNFITVHIRLTTNAANNSYAW